MNSQSNNAIKNFFMKKKNVFAILGGLFAGFVNGIFGGGGGMIIVPLLTIILCYPSQKAHATTILIILPLSILSGLFYAYFGTLNLNVGFPVSIGVTVGGVIGAFLLSKLSSKWLVLIFSFVMVAAGVKMIFF